MQIGAQSTRAASPNLSQKHQLKPFISEEISKESVQQQPIVSTTSSTLTTNKPATSDVSNNMATIAGQQLTASAQCLSSETKEAIVTKSNTNINIAAATSLSGKESLPSSSTKAGENSASGCIDLESFVRDWRHFECQTWHLEPTVRILYWAGKSIEPYGIDYILNKLGFSHARTTIPKWLQRGFMDPLDKVQALMMLQLLAMIRENKQDANIRP